MKSDPAHRSPTSPRKGPSAPLWRRAMSALWAYKFWWMLPLILLIVFYLLLLMTTDMSGASPFRYILF